jgi:IclR family transcriptional regulator, KDG regulon repressor
LRLLQYFNLESPKRSLAELSRLSGLSKPTTYRLLKALEDEGFLARNDHKTDDRHYQLGLRLFELGNLVAEGMQLRRIALPYMEKLRDDINEVVHLVILDRGEALYIERVETDKPLKLFTRIGLRTPLYAGSAARLLFAYMEETEQEEILKNMHLSPFTDSTVKTVEELKALLKDIRQKGYSISFGEYVSGTLGLSVPIRNHTEHVIASLTVAIPGSHFSSTGQEIIIQRLQVTAQLISSKLGYSAKKSSQNVPGS